MIAYLALVIAIIGLLVYMLASNAKAQEVGRILFFCGALVFTSVLGAHAVKLF